jgi:hypothetical protein
MLYASLGIGIGLMRRQTVQNTNLDGITWSYWKLRTIKETSISIDNTHIWLGSTNVLIHLINCLETYGCQVLLLLLVIITHRSLFTCCMISVCSVSGIPCIFGHVPPPCYEAFSVLIHSPYCVVSFRSLLVQIKSLNLQTIRVVCTVLRTRSYLYYSVPITSGNDSGLRLHDGLRLQ